MRRIELSQSRRLPESQIGGGGEREIQYRKAFGALLRNGLYPDQYGFPGVSEEARTLLAERRNMGTGGGNALTGTGGGYFVPVGLSMKLSRP